MYFVAVILAGLAAWAFGVLWYRVFAGPWMAASGVTVRDGKPANAADPKLYAAGAVLMILMAGMLRYVLASYGVETFVGAAISGAGLGLFVAGPWIAMGNLYAMRPIALTLIDGGYAVAGSTIAALILTMF